MRESEVQDSGWLCDNRERREESIRTDHLGNTTFSPRPRLTCALRGASIGCFHRPTGRARKKAGAGLGALRSFLR